jgi:hypothetical protein
LVEDKLNSWGVASVIDKMKQIYKITYPTKKFTLVNTALEVIVILEALPGCYKPKCDFKFHSDRTEKLDFEKKKQNNSGLFRFVLKKKSCFSRLKYA